MNLDQFGAIIDGVLRDHDIQMLIRLPEGTLEPELHDNAGLDSSVIWFYILLNTIPAVVKKMQTEIGELELEPMLDAMFSMLKQEILEVNNG